MNANTARIDRSIFARLLLASISHLIRTLGSRYPKELKSGVIKMPACHGSCKFQKSSLSD